MDLNDQTLISRMHQLKIYEKDIEETFVRSQGPGGQNVNKVSSCVVLKHIPTDITVRCEKSRSQGQNRVEARRLLVEKIEEKIEEIKKAKISYQEYLKRINRKRPKDLKEKILEEKKFRAKKKLSRHKINLKEIDEY